MFSCFLNTWDSMKFEGDAAASSASMEEGASACSISISTQVPGNYGGVEREGFKLEK